MFQRLLDKEAVFFDGRITDDMVSGIMSDISMIAESAGINVRMLFLNLYQIAIIIAVRVREYITLGIVECRV